MLGKERSHLVKKQFEFFVSINTQTTFNQFLHEIFTSKIKQTCEVIIATEGNLPIYANIEGIVSPNNKLCFLTIINITERKLLEDEIQEKQEKFKVLAGVALTGIFTTDPLGNNTYVSPQWSKITGISPDEAKGNGWSKGLHPDDRELIMNDWKLIGSSDIPKTYDFRFIRPDGSLVWVLSQATVVKDNNGRIVEWIGTITDITERKKAEQALRMSEDLLNASQRVSKTGGWEWNVETQAMYWTEETYRIHDITPGEIEPGSAEHIKLGSLCYRHEDRPAILAAFQRCLKEGQPYDLEFPFTSLKGRQLWIRTAAQPVIENGKTVRIIGNIVDITESKQAEEALKISNEKFQSIFNSLQDAFFRADLDGNLTIISPSSPPMFGYASTEEMLGMPAVHLYADALERQNLLKGLSEKGTVKDFIVQARRKDESAFWVSMNVQMIYQNGKLFGTEGLVRDISERKKAELLIKVKNEELRQTNDELIAAKEKAEESDRLKTSFLLNMSHEIRTPMNAIIGFSKMLNNPELGDEKRKSFVSIIVNSTNQLLSIVNDILTISSVETKQEKLNIQKVCINSIIVELLAIFRTQAFNQNISFYGKQQLTDRQSEIYSDKTKIIQILSNLITNAFKFTYQGFIEFGYQLKNEYLEFYVKDSGIGIETEMQEKIFERFRQANESINKRYGGTGLGLAISKAFTELLGGRIWVQSELDKGATFYFTIPYTPVHEIDKTNSPNIQNLNYPTVLVAENDESNFLLIEELLSDMNLKLIHAKDGKEAVEICHTNSKIDLVLMDIKMPIMNGHEAAKILKECKPDLPIVAQSAYALEHERAIFEGIFDDYLTKPINEDILKQMVMKYIGIQKNI